MVGRFGVVYFVVGHGVAWVCVCGGFLVEGDADADEGFEGELLTDDGGGAVVGVEVDEVEEGFCGVEGEIEM